MSDVTFGTWSVAASPVTIEYSRVVIEEIRHEVAEGFQKLSRGGIEVGGVLYGVHQGQTVRIMAIRPAACEHANGPAFRLSEKDRAALRDQIRQDQQDARLEGLVCVGWYVSHTRTEISLSESDSEIFSSFFAHPWQVALIVRPSRGGNMRAGFFVWEPDGTVNAKESYLEFNFPDRLAGAFDHRGSFGERHGGERHGGERQGPERRSVPRPPVPQPMQVQETRFDPPVPAPASPAIPSLFAQPVPAVDGRGFEHTGLESFDKPAAPRITAAKKLVWAAAALICVAALALVGARFFTVDAAAEGMALNVLERDGQLDIQWNRQAALVSKAVHGTLEIADGSQTKTVPLTPTDLAVGRFSYKRGTGDVQVRMVVEEPGGKKLQEASRFLGSAPAKANDEELKTLQERRDELEAEVARLKQSNDQQAQRIQQLERTLKILQTRPGVN